MKSGTEWCNVSPNMFHSSLLCEALRFSPLASTNIGGFVYDNINIR